MSITIPLCHKLHIIMISPPKPQLQQPSSATRNFILWNEWHIKNFFTLNPTYLFTSNSSTQKLHCTVIYAILTDSVVIRGVSSTGRHVGQYLFLFVSVLDDMRVHWLLLFFFWPDLMLVRPLSLVLRGWRAREVHALALPPWQSTAVSCKNLHDRIISFQP